MTTLPQRHDAWLRRLRVHGGGADRAAAGRRAQRLVAAAAIQPAGLSPSAILLVRSLADPLPHALRLDDDRAAPRWERAVADRLAEVARGAARPARGPIDADAAAVLFDDTASLLACFLRDVASGVAAQRWWWRLVPATAGTPPSASGALAAAPHEVPAALELLGGDAPAALGALGEGGAAAVLAAVREAHGVPWMLAEAADDPIAGAVTRPTPRTADDPDAPGVAAAPWREHVAPSVARQLAPAAEELLGTALLLRRDRARARSERFAAQAARWRAARRAIAPRPPVAGALSGPAHEPRAAIPPAAGRAHEPRAADAAPPRLADDALPDAPRAALAIPAPGTAPPCAAPAPPGGTPASPRPGAAEPSPAPVAPTVPAPPPADRPAATPRAPTRLAAARPGEPVHTALGGAFYLLNAAIALDLYGDFTTPATPGIALDPWDFVALLARELLTGTHAGDPLWPLLASLAGRPAGTPPGAGLRSPRAWRAPLAWTAAFEGEPERGYGPPASRVHLPGGVARREHDAVLLARCPGRVVLRHAAGFAVLDVPRRHLPRQARRRRAHAGPARLAAAAQCASELRRRPARVPAGPARGGSARRDPLARWVGWVGSYLRARLAASLDTTSPRELSRRLVEYRATVHVSATHVDVVLALDELAIELRMAGLDRTPGWVPAAGRHLAIHFE